MTKVLLLAAFCLTLFAPKAHAVSRAAKGDAEEARLVATCTNHEASYEFYADDDGKVDYAIEKNKPYPDQRIDCSAGGGSELAVCKVRFQADSLSLYKGGYSVMHYNMDNDSNNDGDKAHCKGSLFK